MNAPAQTETQTPESDDKKARALYMQGKIYRGLAQVFAVLGLIAAAFLYYNATDGDFRRLTDNPFLLIVMVIPFLPAVVLSMKAKKADKEYVKMAAPKA